MAVTGKIVTLYEDTAKTSAVCPRTKVSAVSDANGTGLDALLTTINTNVTTVATNTAAISADYMKFYSGSSAPGDTSGRTVWYDTTNKVLKFYVNGAWQGMNTYQ
jgi:hypothetical protein